MPVVGSSKKTTLGLPMNAMAELTLRLLPPLKSCTSLLLNSSSLNTLVSSFKTRSIFDDSRPRKPAKSLWFKENKKSFNSLFEQSMPPLNYLNVCLTVKYSGKQSNWGQKPRFLNACERLLFMSNPLMTLWPLVALNSPVKILNVVVLPAPFKPKNLFFQWFQINKTSSFLIY